MNYGQGWLARQAMASRLGLVAFLITVLVMGGIAALFTWQSARSAQAGVEREMLAAVEAADQSLQLVYQSSLQRARDVMPVLERALGGTPQLDGTMSHSLDGSTVPTLAINGFAANGNTGPLEMVSDNTGAETALIVRASDGWARAATLLKNSNGDFMNGSRIEAGDLVARTLDSGKEHSGIVQRNGKWYSMYIRPLIDGDGKVYGGLTARISVDADVQRLMQWVENASVANYGRLRVLRNTGGGWEFVNTEADAGQSLSARFSEADRAVFARLFTEPVGVAKEHMDEREGQVFIAWKKVENWDWMLAGLGRESDFLAATYDNLKIQLSIMLIGTLLIAGLVGWLARKTLAPVKQIIDAMARVGQGDLTAQLPKVPDNSHNEVHTLFASLAQMQRNLRNTVRVVRRGVEEINTGSREIAAGNADLSSRTEEQAASLQETAASMEQLASTVKQNADNSRQASQLAEQASKDAVRGGDVVGRVVETMRDISNSSQRISDIVSVIESIAFQTNILALNAAVEAARAGEEGKGFAVVASEVRSLALRSADAAKEIKELIDDSTGKVTAGSQQVEHAGQTMQEIVASVHRVTGIMKEISSASEEQSSGISQVNLAVSQMDQVTQQNAALVEEAAAAAGSLQDQVRQLADAVAIFRLSEDESRQLSLDNDHEAIDEHAYSRTLALAS